MLSFINNLLVLGVVPNNSGGTVAEATAAAQSADPGAVGLGGMNTIVMIAVWAGIIGIFYFFSIRPQSKREKKLKEMQAGIKSGDNVLTTSGFYGKVANVWEDSFLVEFGTNRGVRIPVRKSDIVGIQTPKISPSKPESGS